MSDKKKIVNPGATNPGSEGKARRADGIPENIADAFAYTQRTVGGIIEAPLKLKEILERNRRHRG